MEVIFNMKNEPKQGKDLKFRKYADGSVLKSKRTLGKVYFSIFLFFVFIGFCVLTGFFISYWLDRNAVKFQSPIVLRAPVWTESIETAEAKTVRELEERIKAMEASEAAKPKDAAVVTELTTPESDLSILKKKNIQ